MSTNDSKEYNNLVDFVVEQMETVRKSADSDVRPLAAEVVAEVSSETSAEVAAETAAEVTAEVTDAISREK